MFPEHGIASQRPATFPERVTCFEGMVFTRSFVGQGDVGLGTPFRQVGSRRAGVVASLALLTFTLRDGLIQGRSSLAMG